MTNKRSDARLRRTLDISLGEKLPAVTADVSGGGFCAELAPVFVPGSVIHGSIVFEDQRVPFKGTVAWARPGAPDEGLRSRIGVRFTEIAAEFEAMLGVPHLRTCR